MASGTIKKMEPSNNCHSGPSCSSYRVHHAAKTIEDVSYEMEVQRFYRKIIEEKYFNRCPRKSSPQLSSKTTQTEPDTSNIPSSYLVLGQKLVDELHTDIGNMINTLYHTPNGYLKEEVQKSELDPLNTKVFWQSRLNPDAKLSGGVIRQIYTGEFKKVLHSLFEKTVKLKNALPYIIEIEQGKAPQPIENVTKAGENKVSRTEYENTGIYKDLNPFVDGFCKNQPGCSSDFTGKFEVCSTESYQNNRLAETKEKEYFQEILNKKNTSGYDPRLARGYCVSKRNLTEESSVAMSVPKQTASKTIETDYDSNDFDLVSWTLSRTSREKETSLAKPLLARSESDSNVLAGCSSSALKINAGAKVEVTRSFVQDAPNEVKTGDIHNKVGNASGQDVHDKVGNSSGQNMHKVENASSQDMHKKVGNSSGQNMHKVENASSQDMHKKVGNTSGQNMHKVEIASGQDMHNKVGNATGQNMHKVGIASVQDMHKKVGNASGKHVHDKGRNSSGQNMHKVGNASNQDMHKKVGNASGQNIHKNVGNASGQNIHDKVGNASGQNIHDKMGYASGQDIHDKVENPSGQNIHDKVGNGQSVSNKLGNATGQDAHNKVENACNLNREKRGNEGGHKAGKMDGSDSKNFIKRNIMMASKISTRATTSKLVHDQRIAVNEPGQQTKRNKK